MAVTFSAPVLALSLAVVYLATGAGAAGSTFVTAQDHMSCAGVCSAQGLSAATLRESSGVLQTTACEVNITGQGKRAGYQEGGHSACSVVADSQINSSSEYSCLCLASSTTPGLAAAQGQSCSTACTQSVEGMTGAPVAVESSETSYLCLPSSEIGHTNHFGYTSELDGGASICTAAVVNDAQATSDFSCFCTFESQESMTEAVAPSGSLSSLSESTDATSVGGRKLL